MTKRKRPVNVRAIIEANTKARAETMAAVKGLCLAVSELEKATLRLQLKLCLVGKPTEPTEQRNGQ